MIENGDGAETLINGKLLLIITMPVDDRAFFFF